MFTVILLMLAGVGVGFLLRRFARIKTQGVITVLIWLLLFILGVEVGSNERIIGALHTLGAEALLLAAGSVLGSAVAAWGVWKLAGHAKGGSE